MCVSIVHIFLYLSTTLSVIFIVSVLPQALHRHGQGQDGSPGALEEDNGGEGQEDESGVIVEVGFAA